MYSDTNSVEIGESMIATNVFYYWLSLDYILPEYSIPVQSFSWEMES